MLQLSSWSRSFGDIAVNHLSYALGIRIPNGKSSRRDHHPGTDAVGAGANGPYAFAALICTELRMLKDRCGC